jgi:hypothetical protein
LPSLERQMSGITTVIALIILLVAASGVAARDMRITEILAHDPYLESLVRMRDDYRKLATVEVGFSEEEVDAWTAAIDKAFESDTLEADYRAALERQLPDPVLSATHDYFTSDLRVERDRITKQLLALDINDPTIREGIKAEIEASPRAVSRRAEHLFYEYRSHEAARAVIEALFKAMIIAADPVVGRDNARAWVAEYRDAGMVETYEQSTYLILSATFARYPEASRQAFIDAVSTDEIIAYERAAAFAFERVFTRAVERIKVHYP